MTPHAFNFAKPFKSREGHFCRECNSIIRQPIALERCSNPLRIR